jgi:hypothetical protein
MVWEPGSHGSLVSVGCDFPTATEPSEGRETSTSHSMAASFSGAD